MKIKVSRREAKETVKWIDLALTSNDQNLELEMSRLPGEGEQIRKILSAIIKNLGR